VSEDRGEMSRKAETFGKYRILLNSKHVVVTISCFGFLVRYHIHFLSHFIIDLPDV